APRRTPQGVGRLGIGTPRRLLGNDQRPGDARVAHDLLQFPARRMSVPLPADAAQFLDPRGGHGRSRARRPPRGSARAHLPRGTFHADLEARPPPAGSSTSAALSDEAATTQPQGTGRQANPERTAAGPASPDQKGQRPKTTGALKGL